MHPTTQPGTFRTLSYGPHESQVGDLYVPPTPNPPVVCLLHGGFWRAPYGRDQFAPVAKDLVARGVAVWNIEYRRLGDPGGGWRGTLDDVADAVDHLATLANDGVDVDLARVTVVGHSAGGHLALWVAARQQRASMRIPLRVQPIAAVGLAPVADLARTWALDAGNGAVAEFLGGGPSEYPERYACASPMEMLPLGLDQVVIHGGGDEALPVELSRSYAAAAQAAGDKVAYVELPDAGHMDFLDPGSPAHAVLCQWLEREGPA